MFRQPGFLVSGRQQCRGTIPGRQEGACALQPGRPTAIRFGTQDHHRNALLRPGHIPASSGHNCTGGIGVVGLLETLIVSRNYLGLLCQFLLRLFFSKTPDRLIEMVFTLGAL